MANKPGIASKTLRDWQDAALLWLAETTGSNDPDVGAIIANIEALSTSASRVSSDFRKPVQADDIIGTDGVWQTVFGFRTPNEQMLAGRQAQPHRSDFPERYYWLLPEVPNGSHGYALAIEEDKSYRLLALEDGGGRCEALIPLSERYLPVVLLTDCLGELLYCTTCLGVVAGPNWRSLPCPGCRGDGHLPMYDLLLIATWQFVESSSRDQAFSSRALREHLARVVEVSGE